MSGRRYTSYGNCCTDYAVQAVKPSSNLYGDASAPPVLCRGRAPVSRSRRETATRCSAGDEKSLFSLRLSGRLCLSLSLSVSLLFSSPPRRTTSIAPAPAAQRSTSPIASAANPRSVGPLPLPRAGRSTPPPETPPNHPEFLIPPASSLRLSPPPSRLLILPSASVLAPRRTPVHRRRPFARLLACCSSVSFLKLILVALSFAQPAAAHPFIISIPRLHSATHARSIDPSIHLSLRGLLRCHGSCNRRLRL